MSKPESLAAMHVPAQINDPRGQLHALFEDLNPLIERANKMPLSRLPAGGIPLGEFAKIFATYEAHETLGLGQKRISKLTLGLFSRRAIELPCEYLRFAVAYHLFNDNEGTSYMTTDADTHGNQLRFPNLTVAVDHALAHLSDGLILTAQHLTDFADECRFATLKLRNEI